MSSEHLLCLPKAKVNACCSPKHIGGPGAESSPGSVGSRCRPAAPLRAVPPPFRSDCGRSPPPFSRAAPACRCGPRPRDVSVSLCRPPRNPGVEFWVGGGVFFF